MLTGLKELGLLDYPYIIIQKNSVKSDVCVMTLNHHFITFHYIDLYNMFFPHS